MGVWMEVAGSDDDLGVKISWEITHNLPDNVLYGELPDGEDDLDCEAIGENNHFPLGVVLHKFGMGRVGPYECRRVLREWEAVDKSGLDDPTMHYLSWFMEVVRRGAEGTGVEAG